MSDLDKAIHATGTDEERNLGGAFKPNPDAPKAQLGDLPPDVDSAMYLRDGYPYAVVCKVQMRDGCIGIGIVRTTGVDPSIEEMDAAALADAIVHVAPEPPDYTDLHDHIAKMAALAQKKADPDDTQAAQGHPAHD